MSGSVDGQENRIEQALVWLLRIILILLALWYLVRGQYADAVIVGVMLALHTAAYLAAPRIEPLTLRRWSVTLADTIFGSLAFYFTGDLAGQGSILGFGVAAVVVARFALWSALGINAVVWLLFTLPFFNLWLGQGEAFPLPILSNFVGYLALTLVLSYVVSVEARQSRLGRDATQRLRQLSSVHEVSTSITSTLEMDAVLDLVMTKALELLNAEAGSLLLLEESGIEGDPGELVFRVVTGPVAESLVGQRFRADEGIVGAVVQTGQAQLSNEPRLDPNWSAALDSLTGFETHSILCAPMSSRDRTVGALEVINKLDGTPFGSEDVELLSTFAAQAAIALENARLYEETNRRLQQVNTLYKVGRSLATLDTERVLSTVAEQVVQTLDVDVCGVFLHERTALGEEYTVLQALHDPDGTASGMLGSRYSLPEHEWLRQLIREQGSATFESVETDERLTERDTLRQMLVMLGIRSCVFVGLYAADKALGFVGAAERHTARTFSPDEIQICQALANQAVVAIENARLYEQTDEALNKRLHELAIIEEIGHELGSSLDYDHSINLVLARAIEACDACSGAIGVLLPNGKTLDVRRQRAAKAGQAPELIADEWPVEQGIVDQVVRLGQSVYLSDVSAEPECVAIPEGTRSHMAVPIKRENRVIGVFSLDGDQPAAFTQDDLHFLEHLSDHAGIAIANARLFQEERQRVQALSTISEISREVRASLDLERTLNLILTNLENLVEFAYAEICLWDEAREVMVTRASAGDRSYMAQAGGVYRLDEGFTGWIASHQQYLHLPDIAARSDVQPKIVMEDTPFRSYLGLPLRIGETLVGTLEMASNRVNAYRQEHLEFLQIIADQAAIAIQNASLFEAQQRQVRELGLLFETSAAISSSLDLNQVLRTVGRYVARALQVSSCTISEWDPDANVVRTMVDENTAPDQSPGDVGLTYSLDDYPATAEVLRARQPQVIQVSDPEADAAERALLEEQGYQSLLMMPLVARDRVVGLLELFEARETREFTKDDIRLCQALASQAAVAIENAQLYEQTDVRLQARVDEMTALQRTTKELSATLALDSILKIVLESAIETTAATYGNVMLLDMDTGNLKLRIAQGYSEEEQARIEEALLHLDKDSISRQVLESGEARLVADAYQESYTVCVRADTRSALAVPIRYGIAVVGLIHLRDTEPNAFDADDLSFAQSLAEQAALAIGNSLRFEDQVRANTALSRRSEQMDSLLAVSQKLRADVPLDDALEDVAYAIQETVGFNIVLISIVEGHDTGAPVLRRIAAAGLPLDVFEEAKKVRQPLSRYEDLFREEYRQGLCYFFPFQQRHDWGQDLHTVDIMPEGQEWEEGQWHRNDMLLAPLRGAGGRILGHISVDEPRNGRRPNRQTLESLAIFANQAAIAVENTNLYADAQRRADNLTLINRVAQTLAQVTEPAPVLNSVVQAVSELLRCDMSIIFQPDPFDGKLEAVASHGLSLTDVQHFCAVPDEAPPGKVAQTGAPLLISNIDDDPYFQGRDVPVGSMALVPIKSGRRQLGVLTACCAEKNALTQADQVLLATLADQAAVALESARLFVDTQQAAVRLSLLNEIGRRAAAQLELQEMLETTVNALHMSMGYYRVAMFLVDQSAQELYVAAANTEFWPVIPTDYRQKVGEGLVGAAAASGETILANDALADPRLVAVADWAAPSSLSVPVQVGDSVVGVLHVEAERRGAFAEEDAAALEIASDQLAVTIHNAQLFQATQRQADHLDALRQVTQDLTALRDLDTLLYQIIDRAMQLLGGEAGGIYLYRPSRELLEWAVAIGQDVAPVGTTLEKGEGLSGRVWETGQPQMVHSYQAWPGKTEKRPDQPAAILAVPIQWGDEFLGVLNIRAKSDVTAFTQQDTELLAQFSDQAAIAIQNARLFQETSRRVAELATVNQIGRAISSALDVDLLIDLIYGQVSNLLDTRNFFIAFYEPERELIRIDYAVEEGQLQEPIELRVGQGLTSYLLTTGQPLLLTHDIDKFIEEHSLTREGPPAKSWLGVPMVAEDRVIGALAVQSYEREGAFDTGHLELLTTIAGQAAVAFHNAALFDERERRISELGVLNEMAQAISSTLEMDDLLQAVYDQVSPLLDTTNFYIALYDDEKDEISFPFTVDPEQREDWSPRKGGMGLTGRILQSGEPLLLPTGAAGLYREAGKEVQAGMCRSWLGVPMIAEDRALGVIAVQSYEQEYVYDEEDMQVLSTVAAQVAVAVRNAQLYQQIVSFSGELERRVEDRTRELAQAARELTTERDRAETLYRITSELGTTLDLERVLLRALQLFADTLGVQHGTVMLLDQETGFLDLKASLERQRELGREGWRTPLKRGVGLAGWVLQERQPALVSDLSKDERWLDIPDREIKARSIVIAPLSLGGGDILGVLTLGHPEVGYFSREHLQLVTAAAAQVAVAVSNSDLYAFITDQADQLGSTLQAMQAEADKSRSILESIADGVLVLDHQGRVLLVNPAAEELLGVSAMALEGDHYRHMLGLGESEIHRQLANGLHAELRRRLGLPEGDEGRLQATTFRLEAGQVVLAVNIAPLITTIGETPGLVAALRDVTREAEVERLKNEFISTVSHELRTPMTSIKGYTDLLFLGMAGGLTDAQRNFLQIIKSNADRLTALVNDILDISRIETGRLRLTIEALDLPDIISQTITSFEGQYREKGIALEWEPVEGLPEVRGDAARITQVLTNLIANAWHYTEPEGRVSVSVCESDGYLQVDVADTGIGIAPDDISRIFDRFYRVDHPVVQEAEGTGLGLSIVRMFIEMLGGDIWVESELGVGSTFSFTVPLMTTALDDLEIVEPELISTEAVPVLGRRPKILVVEADRDLALLLRHQLEFDGYQVVLAGSGEDALWLAKEEQPQLITLDIMLPDMDGFLVLEQLRDHPATAPIPVIIISGLSEVETGYALGAVDYVVKPFEEDKLLRSVQLALSPLEEGEEHDLLIVDDDPDILLLLKHALSFHGYKIRTAMDGLQALERVKEAHPDLILLDIKMPKMDGYEVIRELKTDESTRSIPVIVITASPVDKERDKVRVLGMGATQYITKPLSIETLVREIKFAIEERQQE